MGTNPTCAEANSQDFQVIVGLKLVLEDKWLKCMI